MTVLLTLLYCPRALVIFEKVHLVKKDAILDADRRIFTSGAKLDIMIIRRIRRRLLTRVMTTMIIAKTTVIGIIASEAKAIPETAGDSLHPR